MKKIILSALTSVALASVSFAQDHHIQFVDVELDSAYALAKEEGKLVFVDCYTTWCGPCKWMDANIFTSKEVAEYFNQNFINVKLDMEAGEGEVFAGWYEVRSYPTYIFLDVSGRRNELVHRTVGTMEADRFIQFARDASNEEVRIGTARKRYYQGERSPEFIKQYIVDLYAAGYSSDASEVAYWYYQNVDWKSLDSTDGKVLLRFVNGNAHPLWEGMMENISSVEKIVDSEMLYQTMFRYVSSPVWIGLRGDNPKESYEKVLMDIEMMQYSQKTRLGQEIEMYYYQETDPKQYLQLAPTFAENYFKKNWEALNSIAWEMYEATTDKNTLKRALKLASMSVDIEANYFNLDTKMRLLYALGKKKEALAVGDQLSAVIDGSEAHKNNKEAHEAALAAIRAGKDIRDVK